MSFIEYKRTISTGDYVVAYKGPENMVLLKIEPDAVYTNEYGQFKHKDMVGLEFGTQMFSSAGKGWIYLLHPTPELWTLLLPHRTQIIYFADIAVITSYLELKPGSVVIEAGTGSGSLSHSIYRTIAPSGKLYTFEFHAQRAERAREEFKAHGMSSVVELQCRDVCKQGFGISGVADAVFLDLPSPWEAIPHAAKVFKGDVLGKICCFSPCIEQVQRNCSELRQQGFADIRTIECLTKNYDVFGYLPGKKNSSTQKRKMESVQEQQLILTKPTWEMRGHTAYLTFANHLPKIRVEPMEE